MAIIIAGGGIGGLCVALALDAIGVTTRKDGKPLVTVDGDQTRELRVNVVTPPSATVAKSSDVVFRIIDVSGGGEAKAADFFKAP